MSNGRSDRAQTKYALLPHKHAMSRINTVSKNRAFSISNNEHMRTVMCTLTTSNTWCTRTFIPSLMEWTISMAVNT